jgi:hypothetical protein
MYQVIDWEKDPSDKWRIRVAMTEHTVTFKYDDWPDDETVQGDAARYDAMMQQQLQADDYSEILDKAARYDAMMQEQMEAAALEDNRIASQEKAAAMEREQTNDATDPE